jgi:hypothetical protein
VLNDRETNTGPAPRHLYDIAYPFRGDEIRPDAFGSARVLEQVSHQRIWQWRDAQRREPPQDSTNLTQSGTVQGSRSSDGRHAAIHGAADASRAVRAQTFERINHYHAVQRERSDQRALADACGSDEQHAPVVHEQPFDRFEEHSSTEKVGINVGHHPRQPLVDLRYRATSFDTRRAV